MRKAASHLELIFQSVPNDLMEMFWTHWCHNKDSQKTSLDLEKVNFSPL